MRAFDKDGQAIIDSSKSQLRKNIECIISQKPQIEEFLQNKEIEKVKRMVLNALELTHESASLSFIARDGLVAMVFNDETDARNHRLFADANRHLYSIYCNLFKLPKDVSDIQLMMISNDLSKIFDGISAYSS